MGGHILFCTKKSPYPVYKFHRSVKNHQLVSDDANWYLSNYRTNKSVLSGESLDYYHFSKETDFFMFIFECL